MRRLILLIAAMALGCTASAPPPDVIIDRVDDLAFVRLEAGAGAGGDGVRVGPAGWGGVEGVRPRAGRSRSAPMRARTPTEKTPPAGQDILSAAGHNYYQRVRLADLAGFAEHYPLNSRLVK